MTPARLIGTLTALRSGQSGAIGARGRATPLHGVLPGSAPAGLAGALLGLIFFVAVYGVSILSPTRIDWLLHGDPAQHYLGFAFFRHEPWAWPLGAIAGFGAPLGTSLVYTDAIALLAIPFKLLSDWLPTDFQYLGGWMLLCYLLQGVYAERVLARLGVTGLAGALATVLLLTSPALALRAYGHESLMAHWLLLAAFEAHLAGRPRRLAPLWALGALIHAYWIALLAPFVLAGWLRRELGWAHRIGWLMTIVTLMTAVGYFVTRPEQLAGVGYGQYSANLLTFIDPMDWRAFLANFGRPLEVAAEWSRWLPAQGHAQPEQYEGFAYLGSGVLLLLACAALSRRLSGRAQRPSAQGPGSRPSLALLLFLALVLFAYSLSTRITLGTRVLADPALPEQLAQLLAVFRASGRFVWPLALLLPLWACAQLSERLSRASLAGLLLAAGALQVWDLSAKWAEFGARFAPGGIGRQIAHDQPAWQAAAKARHLIVLPANYERDWIAPALFAARHQQSVNIGLISRADEKALQRAEAQAIASLLAGRAQAQTAYLIRDPALLARLPRLPSLQRLPLPDGVMLAPR